MVEQVNGTVDEAVNLYVEAAEETLKELVEVTWPKAAQEDKEIGGVGGKDLEKNCELAKRAAKATCSEKLFNLLDPKTKENPEGTGYGSHPELVRLFLKLGKMMSDDELVFKGLGSEKQEKAVEDVFYDKTE